MKFLDNRNYRFWLCNLLFWVAFFAICMFYSPPFLAFKIADRLILSSTFIAWALLFTGCYRWVYHRFQFEDKTYVFTIFQIIVSSIILTFLDIFGRHYGGVLFSMSKKISMIDTGDFSLVYKLAYDKSVIHVDQAVQKDIIAFVSMVLTFVQIFKFLAFVIWTVAFNAYGYTRKLRQREIETLAAENRAKDLELINLRSQLNPHFLFNALNSIHSLAMMKKDNASDAVLLLSDLMRYTLNYEKRDLVPLADEIEVVEKYLGLEKIRFGKKLNTELNISENTLGVKIPPIVVQTLVENAIKHGLKESPNGVFIKIESRLEEGFLKIDIINSGQLRNSTPSVNQPKSSGIGVENTRRRLEMIYGEAANLELKNRNEMEVIASLRLPIV
jgi:sensor histidine kinase YesM